MSTQKALEGHSESTWAHERHFKGTSRPQGHFRGYRRTLGHSKGPSKALEHSCTLGTRALERHLGTQALSHLENRGAQGTLFSRLHIESAIEGHLGTQSLMLLGIGALEALKALYLADTI